jgi:hypothetical protein
MMVIPEVHLSRERFDLCRKFACSHLRRSAQAQAFVHTAASAMRMSVFKEEEEGLHGVFKRL